MRLIDADALKEALHNFFDGKVINEPTYILCDVLCHIDNAPTVNPSLNLDNITEDDIKKFKMIWQRANSKGLLVINEERLPGKWELRGERCYCSECGEEAINLEFESDVYSSSYCLTNYCPNCGADMRGEENGS